MNIQDLLDNFSIRTTNYELYELAFTHKSFNGDAKTKHHDYERLEFLGDSIIGCVAAKLAFKLHPEMEQGPLSKLKSAIVSTKSLSSFAQEYHFDKYILVGNSFTLNKANVDPLFEDVFEAFMGALFLDQGYQVVENVLTKIFYKKIKDFDIENLKDYKSKLQEEVQAEHRESVKYSVIKEEGPSHNKTFTVKVTFDGVILGIGVGSTKKKAEQEAARQALEKRVI